MMKDTRPSNVTREMLDELIGASLEVPLEERYQWTREYVRSRGWDFSRDFFSPTRTKTAGFICECIRRGLDEVLVGFMSMANDTWTLDRGYVFASLRNIGNIITSEVVDNVGLAGLLRLHLDRPGTNAHHVGEACSLEHIDERTAVSFAERHAHGYLLDQVVSRLVIAFGRPLLGRLVHSGTLVDEVLREARAHIRGDLGYIGATPYYPSFVGGEMWTGEMVRRVEMLAEHVRSGLSSDALEGEGAEFWTSVLELAAVSVPVYLLAAMTVYGGRCRALLSLGLESGYHSPPRAWSDFRRLSLVGCSKLRAVPLSGVAGELITLFAPLEVFLDLLPRKSWIHPPIVMLRARQTGEVELYSERVPLREWSGYYSPFCTPIHPRCTLAPSTRAESMHALARAVRLAVRCPTPFAAEVPCNIGNLPVEWHAHIYAQLSLEALGQGTAAHPPPISLWDLPKSVSREALECRLAALGPGLALHQAQLWFRKHSPAKPRKREGEDSSDDDVPDEDRIVFCGSERLETVHRDVVQRLDSGDEFTAYHRMLCLKYQVHEKRAALLLRALRLLAESETGGESEDPERRRLGLAAAILHRLPAHALQEVMSRVVGHPLNFSPGELAGWADFHFALMEQ